MPDAGSRQRAFVIGGGLAGLTVAKELAAEGFKVLVFEASDQLGGKAGARTAAAHEIGRWGDGAAGVRPVPPPPVPHEHGYHIFPGWYANTRKLLADLGVAERLIDLRRFYHLRRRYRPRPIGRIESALRRFAQTWRAVRPPDGPLRSRLTIFEETWPPTNVLLNIIDGPTRPSHSLVYFYALLDLAGRQLSQADHLDRISANGFLSARRYVSDDVARFQHQTVLQASAIANFELSAMTVQKLTRCWFEVPSPMVSILPENLQDGFIAPFAAFLRTAGVQLIQNAMVTRLCPRRERTTDVDGNVRVHTFVDDVVFADGRPLSAWLPELDPAGPVLTARDVIVLATPLEATLRLVDREVDALERRPEPSRPAPLAGLAYLEAAPMVGLQVYCDAPVAGMPREHVFLTDSQFGLSLIDVSQHWAGHPPGTVLSAIASDFASLQPVYEALRAGPGGEHAARGYVAARLLDEIAAYIPLPPCTYSITPNAEQPLFLNTVGAWTHRPDGRTRFDNLYVAGDYCRSQADLTSMESAIGSAVETAAQILSDCRVRHDRHAEPLAVPHRWALLGWRALMTPAMLPFGAWNAAERILRRWTTGGRYLVVGAPYSEKEFATPFRATEALGLEFFRHYAETRHHDHAERARTGLMRSLDALASSAFDPGAVHPLIRQFYERTYRFDMQITITWHHVFKALGALYQRLIARPMQNLVIPLDEGALTDLDSWLETIDKDWDGEADYTIWIRVAKGSRLPVYVGAYRTYRSRADELSYVSVVFPWPIGNLTTVLVPTNWAGDGFQLATRHAGAADAGVYLIYPGERRFTMLPTPLSERFRLRVDGDTIRVEHLTWAFGARAITIHYEISEKRARRPGTWRALGEAADRCDREA